MIRDPSYSPRAPHPDWNDPDEGDFAYIRGLYDAFDRSGYNPPYSDLDLIEAYRLGYDRGMEARA